MLVKASLYLDKRYLNKDGKSALRIALRHKGQCSYLHTNIFLYPDTWDGNSVIGGRDAKILNGVIYQKLTSVESAIIKLQSDGAFFRKNIDEIAHLIMIEVDPEYAEKVHEQQMINYAASNGIYARFLQYIDQRNAEGTKSIYRWTLQMIELFCKKNRANANTLLFDDITIAWLESFQKFCRLTEKQNSVAIHLRNIRTVLNAAIDDGITSNYPFRKFKIKTEETVDKSYTARELRTFFQAKCYTDGVQEAQDMFKLMFCLIGINIKDLMYLDGLYKGRVVYSRMKTGKPYSVKVVPEAMEIIRKYQGKNLMLNCLERICRW